MISAPLFEYLRRNQAPVRGRSTKRTGFSILIAGPLFAMFGVMTASTPAHADSPECAPRLVRAVTHFPEHMHQFRGDGVVDLGVEVDRNGRVVRAEIENSRAAPALFEAARTSALREWLFDVNACTRFPARAIVRVEFQRPPVHTFSASRARSRDIAAALPANADCTRNERPRFADHSVVSCLMNERRIDDEVNQNRSVAKQAREDSAGQRAADIALNDQRGN